MATSLEAAAEATICSQFSHQSLDLLSAALRGLTSSTEEEVSIIEKAFFSEPISPNHVILLEKLSWDLFEILYGFFVVESLRPKASSLLLQLASKGNHKEIILLASEKLQTWTFPVNKSDHVGVLLQICITVFQRLGAKDLTRLSSSVLDSISSLLPTAKNQSDLHRKSQSDKFSSKEEKLNEILSIESVENDPSQPGDPAAMVVVRVWSFVTKFTLDLFDLIASKNRISKNGNFSSPHLAFDSKTGKLVMQERYFFAETKFAVSLLGYVVSFQILTYSRSRKTNADFISRLVDVIHSYGRVSADEIIMMTNQQRKLFEEKKKSNEEATEKKKMEVDAEDEDEIFEELYSPENWSELGVAYLYCLENFLHCDSFPLLESNDAMFLEKCISLISSLMSIRPPFCKDESPITNLTGTERFDPLQFSESWEVALEFLRRVLVRFRGKDSVIYATAQSLIDAVSEYSPLLHRCLHLMVYCPVQSARQLLHDLVIQDLLSLFSPILRFALIEEVIRRSSYSHASALFVTRLKDELAAEANLRSRFVVQTTMRSKLPPAPQAVEASPSLSGQIVKMTTPTAVRKVSEISAVVPSKFPSSSWFSESIPSLYEFFFAVPNDIAGNSDYLISILNLLIFLLLRAKQDAFGGAYRIRREGAAIELIKKFTTAMRTALEGIRVSALKSASGLPPPFIFLLHDILSRVEDLVRDIAK